MKVILDTYDAADEENKVDFEMEDGSMSCKIFKTEGLLLPDNVVAPSKVSIPCSVPRFSTIDLKDLHISGLNTVSEAEVKNLLGKFSAPMLVKFKADKDQETDECQRPAGEIYFSSISESLEALILVNNRSWSKFKELYSYHGILL